MNNKIEGMVSIIIPVYNGEMYIKRCIESILRQSYTNFEIIIVNDGSIDRTLEVCKKMEQIDNRIRILNQVNQGVSSARNRGIDCINGEYFTFVDADDSLVECALEVALEYLQDADVVTYGWDRKIEYTRITESIFEEFAVINNRKQVLKEILKHYSAYGGGYPWNKLWRSSSFDKGQIPKFDKNLFYFEDLEWVIRMMLQVNKLVVCPECLYQYSVYEGSVTTDSNRAEAKEISYHRAIDKIIEVLEIFPDIQWWMKEKYAPEIVNGVVHAKRNEWNELEEYLRKQLNEEKQLILQSKKIPLKTKARCLGLLFRK